MWKLQHKIGKSKQDLDFVSNNVQVGDLIQNRQNTESIFLLYGRMVPNLLIYSWVFCVQAIIVVQQILLVRFVALHRRSRTLVLSLETVQPTGLTSRSWHDI